jgi:hypothetical protein
VRVPRGPCPPRNSSDDPASAYRTEAALRCAADPKPGQEGSDRAPPPTPNPWSAPRGSPHPQLRAGLGSPTPEARGSRAMEGAPAPPVGSLPRRGRAERAPGSSRGAGAVEGCWWVAARAQLPGLHTHPHSHRLPLPQRLLAPPIAGGFAEHGRRLDAAACAASTAGAGRGSPGEPRRHRRRPALPRASERPGGRRQLTRSAPLSQSSTRSTPEPAVIFPAAPSPAPARCPAPGAPLFPLDRRRPHPRRPRAPAPLRRPRLPPRLREPGQVRRAARSLQPVRPPASQPPAPLFRALGTAGEAARRPRRGPAPPARAGGLTRALKGPRAPRRAA